jgi:hypothetical protein
MPDPAELPMAAFFVTDADGDADELVELEMLATVAEVDTEADVDAPDAVPLGAEEEVDVREELADAQVTASGTVTPAVAQIDLAYVTAAT